MGFIKKYYETGLAIIIKPFEYFKGMAITGGLKDPLIFAIITSIIMGIGLTIITLGVGFLAILLAPLAVTISVFVAAWLLMLCARLVGGKGTFEGTFRVVCYSNVVNVIGWVPFVSILGSLYGLFLTWLGIRDTHQLSNWKAALAVLLAIAIVLVLVILIAIVVIGVTGYVPPAS